MMNLWSKLRNLFIARTADSNVYHDLEDHPREVHLAWAVLAAFVKQSSTYDVTMTPAHRFVKDQAVALACNLVKQMAKEYLTPSHFQDGIENLYFLGHYWMNFDASVAKSVGVDLCRVLDGLTPLMEIAEQTCNLPLTDWVAVSDTIAVELTNTTAEDIEPRCAPSMRHFHLDRLLGAGGFGAVYKAYLGEAVCTLKLVPRSKLPEVENAVAEKEVASMINHPCLVRYHATFVVQEAFVTVMEYVRGVDAIRLVKLRTRLSEEFVRLILAQVGLALCHLHYKGFLHRDVKPANIMIMVGCRVKLIDFDTAKVCIGRFTRRMLPTFFRRTTAEFEDGEIAGTISYMAPEMLKMIEYGRAVDWWSFGITAFYLRTGKLPFSLKPSMSFKKQRSRICKKSHDWPKGIHVSEHLKSLTRACLKKRVSSRFCSERYSDFAEHPLFSDRDLRWVETCPVLIKFDPINSVALGTMTYDVSQRLDSPEATSKAETQRQALFPSSSLLDAQEQLELFTYLSPGFKEACLMIGRGEVPSNEVIRIVPEFVDFYDAGAEFFFASEKSS